MAALSPLALAQGAPSGPAKGAPPALPKAGAPAAPSTTPSAAPAALPDASADSYRQHMDFGISFYEQKNYPAALAEFQEAYKLKPKASPLVNMALCYKAQFAYTKAIGALQTALDKHADTMDDNDKKAAKTEIDEMRARLSYVTFKLSPAGAAVQIDGEARPEASQGQVVQLDPGSHTVKISADGHAPSEQSVTLASGQHQLSYALTPSMGFVKIKAEGQRYAIAVDQKPLEYGEWTGLMEPGQHVIDFYIPGSAAATYRMRVKIEAGKSYEFSRSKASSVVAGPGGLTQPPTPPRPRPPEKPVTGPFVLGAVSVFVPMSHPLPFTSDKLSAGVTGGLRAGYRVNTPVSFDLMFEYSNTQVRDSETRKYTLELFRTGLNLRLQTPNRIARFYGNLGGGFVYTSLDYIHDAPEVKTTGAEGYFLIEGGLQFSAGRVLLDLAIGNILQSTRNITPGIYPSVLDIFQAGLRVGYALW